MAFGLPSLARAQSYPDRSRPIRGIAPASAGTTTDSVARVYAQALSEILGTSVVIDNRAGAQGVIGLQAVKTAPPDGYTIMFTSISTQAINPHLFKQIGYDALADFIPLAGTMKSILLMNAGSSVKANSAREFIAAAKANPGKYAVGSISATTRLAGEMFAKAAGISLLSVPYKSHSDLTSDLLSGRIDLYFADQGAIGPYYKMGLRSLAACSSARSKSLPDVPTMQEQGVAGLEIIGWHGAYAPANTPRAITSVLQDALRQASNSKPVRNYFSTFGTEPLELVGEEFAAYNRAEFERWGVAVREAGLAGTL